MGIHSTRTKILDLLRNEHSATAAEIARSLNLTPSAVRYHLSRLEEEELVELEKAIQHQAAGRPTQAFRLSNTSYPHHLAGLSSALLSIQLSQRLAESDDRVWAELAREIAGTGPGTSSTLLRLSFCVRELNRMNYQARWEAGAQGPRVIFSNCPYAAIWPRFPGLCQMDRFLLERWTGRELVQTGRIDFQGRKHKTCIFEGVPGPKLASLQLA